MKSKLRHGRRSPRTLRFVPLIGNYMPALGRQAEALSVGGSLDVRAENQYQ
jgi:hypothetical protein